MSTVLDLKYQGQQASRDRNSKTFKETWIGDEASIDSKLAEFSINTFYDGKGFLRSWRKSQDQGPHYVLELEFGESFGNGTGYSDEVVTGQKSAQLSTRVLQMPLEKAPNNAYRTHWNHYLIGKNTTVAPLWYLDATDILIPSADIGKYAWVKTLGEVDQANGWDVVGDMSKPGVEYFELSYYTVTVSAAYRSASSAGSAINKSINRIFTNFQYDFGLGGEWKLDDAQVYYSGKSWIGTNTYSRAVDEWDRDLYGTF